MKDAEGESPSDEEKKLGIENGKLDNVALDDLPPDPDAHLSEAERIAIVRISCGFWVLPRC